MDYRMQNQCYWENRAEGYSLVNQTELHTAQHKRWQAHLDAQIRAQHPGKSREEIRVLEVGCGPGFFAIILSELGYAVTAVDYTAHMLEQARKNAKEYGQHPCFLEMDASALTFSDASFDVVVSRNLTWNLPEPEKAYREWLRVLAEGGTLLVYDANWYGYLYDEEKRMAYEKDRQNVERSQLDDHYLCTDIDRMEEIAKKVPLSAKNRPGWDVEVLKEIGFAEIRTDESIWQSVWSEEERLNYASTPMFLVSGQKGEN